MKQILSLLLVLFAFTGCDQKKEDQTAHDAKVAQQAREQLLKELKAKEKAERSTLPEAHTEQSTLVQAGIKTTPDGKIIIDTNKTKSYFEKMAKRMKEKMDKLASDMKKGALEEKEAGIEVSQEKIVIDVNRTKGFMEQWAKKMETFVKEMDEVARTIEPDSNVSQ